MYFSTPNSVQVIIYELVLAQPIPLSVEQILSTFTHLETSNLETEAKLWFEEHKCQPDDIVIIVEDGLLGGYLVVPTPDSEENSYRMLL